MKVKKLMEFLSKLPPNTEVILQKDAEGNGYSPLAGADSDAVYVKETSWLGSVYSTDWSADDACMNDSQWNELLKKPRCVVLFPVN